MADVWLNASTAFESVNYPGYFIYVPFYAPSGSTVLEAGIIHTPYNPHPWLASFILRPALSGDSGAVSFESPMMPGAFLRHEGFRLKIQSNDNSELFRQDASFYLRSGLAELQPHHDHAEAGPVTMSFEAVNARDHFIRHRNFELWVDRYDDSILFRNDASFRPKRGFIGNLRVNRKILLMAADYEDHWIRHQFWVGQLTRLVNELDVKDATFTSRRALSGRPDAVSLESLNYPGHFLRHQDFRLKLHANDGSELFARDATFIERLHAYGLFSTNRGMVVSSQLRLESENFRGQYVRHSNYELWVAADDGSEQFRWDSTFLLFYDIQVLPP
jgi:hypothetical protein